MTRNEIKQYALDICLPMLEAAAERRLSCRSYEVADYLGYTSTMLEECLRPFWGLAPILRDTELYMNVSGERIAVGEWLRRVLVEGTDPENELWFDKYRECNNGFWHDFQNVTEFAGALIACFFAREATWDRFTPAEQRQVADYLANACIPLCEHAASNNHIWFPLFCLLILKKLGYSYPRTDELIEDGLERLEAMYVGNGWYCDGAFGRVDYYVAWSMHAYPMLWCLIEDESYPRYAERRAVYLERVDAFLADYCHFFEANGAHPPFGRSLAYRFAASCVFPLAILAGASFDPSLSGEITRRNIAYFKENTRVGKDNILPPGYLYNAPSFVEYYTSSGGAYWASKTFMCLLLPEDHDFWKSAVLPIEKGDYIVSPKESRLNLAVAGDGASGVTVYNNVFQYQKNGAYANRFNDMAAYYGKFCYNSRAGFAVSTRDLTASDSMLSLITPDGSMMSHRWSFVDLGRDGDVMISEHVPFSNDPETTVRTWLLPLDGSLNVRVHRVVLSREYSVREGGYAIGLDSDYRDKREENRAFSSFSEKLTSVVKTVATVATRYSTEMPQPGCFSSAPRAVYPLYETDVLEAGEYIFASAFAVLDVGATYELPSLELNGDKVNVSYKSKTVSIDTKDR